MQLSSKISQQIWHTGLYIRLSREDGNDESYSIQNQRNKLLAYIDMLNAEGNECLLVHNIYVDDGKTGTDTNREGLQTMLQDIAQKKINCVMVKDLSRLSRNYIDAGMFLEYDFLANHIRFISLELPQIDSYRRPESASNMMVAIQNVFNDNFARETSEKIRSTLNMKRQRGEFIGAFAPFGYQKDPNSKNQLVIDPKAAAIVKQIYTWYGVHGESKQSIAKKLNALGILSPAAYKKKQGSKHNSTKKTDGLWSVKAVSTVLQNPVYLGHMVQGKQRVVSYKVHKRIETSKEEWYIQENTHAPIITSDLFEKVQALHRSKMRTQSGTHTVPIFSGLLRCGTCGKGLSRSIAKGIVYYSCRTHKERSTRHCTPHRIREDEIYTAVLEALRIQWPFIHSDAVRAAHAQLSQQPNTYHTLTQVYKAHETMLQSMQSMQKELYYDWKLGVLSQTEYHTLKADMAAKIQALEAQLAAATAQMEEHTRTEADALQTLKEISSLNRRLVLSFIDQIKIYEHKRIEILFTIKNPMRDIVADTAPEQLLQANSTPKL